MRWHANSNIHGVTKFALSVLMKLSSVWKEISTAKNCKSSVASAVDQRLCRAEPWQPAESSIDDVSCESLIQPTASWRLAVAITCAGPG